MKLLNLNVGIKIDNNEKVKDLINKDDYDIVTLQEVMKKVDNNVFSMYDSSNFINTHTNYKYNYFGPLWYANHHEKNNKITKDFGGVTEQGNEVLSKYPFIQTENVFYYQNYAEFTDTTNFKIEDHPRAFTNTILNINDKPLQIINIHGIWNKDKIGDDRPIKQSEILLSHIRKDIPCVIVGDFNLLPNTKSIKMINKEMTNLIGKYNIKSTRPSFDDGLDKGNIVCDYIFTNNKVKINNFQVLNDIVSDHLALVLEFEI